MQPVALVLGFAVTLLGEALMFLATFATRRTTYARRLFWRELVPTVLSPLPLISTFAVSLAVILAIEMQQLLARLALERPLIDLVATAIIRHFAPLLIGVFVSSRTGLRLAVKLGSHVLRRDVDALVLFGISPVRFLVAPFAWLFMISVVVLSLWCTGVALLAASLILDFETIVPVGVFWEVVEESINLGDLGLNLTKCLLAALAVLTLAAYNGLSVRERSGDLSELAVRTTTHSILVVILIEVIVTVLTF